MYVFVIEPRSKFFRKINEKYEIYIENGIDFSIKPYYLYRINDSYSLQDLEVAEILISKDDFTKPPLFAISMDAKNILRLSQQKG